MGRKNNILSKINLKPGDDFYVSTEGLAFVMVLLAALVYAILSVVYLVFGVMPVFYSNLAMLVLHLFGGLFVLRKGGVTTVLYVEYLFAIIHSLYACLAVGWSYGYSVWFVSLPPMSFMVFYYLYRNKFKTLEAFILNITVTAIICVIRLIDDGDGFVHVAENVEELQTISTIVNMFACTVACSFSAALSINQNIHYDRELKVRENAKAANEAKTQFLANMSHEIRTPINAMIGMNEMILRDSREPDTLERANDIKNAGNALVSLISDILDFSNIESNKLRITPVEYRVDKLIADSYVLVDSKIKQKRLKFSVKNDPKMPASLVGDKTRIRQIIVNLLLNAIKFTDEGGITIDVSSEVIDEVTGDINLKISVTDTGYGMAKSELDSIFDPFSKGEASTDRNIEGVGLGLSITKRILELMDGSISAESIEGIGSKFTITLPQKVASHEFAGDISGLVVKKDKVQVSNNSSIMATSSGATVLIVDDVPINIKVVRGLLSKTGLNIITCLSGEECLNIVKQTKVDLILLDHMMPKMDGLEVWSKLRGPEYNLEGKVPVIMMTANALVGEREAYLAQGFSDYISKPVDPDELIEKVFKLLPDQKN